MLHAAELRARAAEYRTAAKGAGDPRIRQQYLAVAKYLDDWAAEAEAKDAASPSAAPWDRQVG